MCKRIFLKNHYYGKAQKMRKSIFLIKELESEKVIEFRPPLFFNFMRGHTSSTFSNSCSFLSYAFLGSKFTFQNTDFWEKSFCTAVSIPKSFHMTMEALWSEIHQPTLTAHVDLDNCNKWGFDKVGQCLDDFCLWVFHLFTTILTTLSKI